MGMDKAIEKKTWTLKKVITIGVVCTMLVSLGYLTYSKSGKSRLKVDPTRMTMSQISQDEFLEYIPINGTVLPLTTVFLDIEEGGRVDEIFVEGGNPIEKGDLILQFSNASLHQQSIDSESRLVENLNQLRNTKFSLAEKKLTLQDKLLDMDYEIMDLERTCRQYEMLKETGDIAEDRYVAEKDKLDYMNKKRALLKERISQENILREQQLKQVDDSIERVTRSMEITGRMLDRLEVRAPISGHLSTLKADIGENISKGERIGQIDLLGDFKVRASMDQYYISRVVTGQPGTFIFDGQSFTLTVQKIYPEVANDTFEADMAFNGDIPEGIIRGQSLQINLSLSNPEKCLIIPKGGFYQETSGRWAYVISEDRQTAFRTDILIGRQNPGSLEVLEGLREGDWIITSGYGTFNKVDELVFPEALKLAY